MKTSFSQSPKDTVFLKKTTVNCGGKLLILDEPLIMGILNATPDSFFKESRLHHQEDLTEKAGQMVEEGAKILDIGGYSTRPGAQEVSTEEEWQRVEPVIKAIGSSFPDTIISIDTFRPEIARRAVDEGAGIINDISGGQFDKRMFETVAELNVPYVLMHIKGTPETMQKDPQYDDVTSEVSRYFSEKVTELHKMGVNDIILDPGFGFGKNLQHNFRLLKDLRHFQLFNCPVLAGVSRKSMINQLLHTQPETSLNGTTVINTLAMINGAAILRVHDPKEAAEARKILTYYHSLPN